MARILVFDGQGVYRTGLRIVISANIPCAKIIEASSLIEALSEIRKDVFDLVLVGIDCSSSKSLDFLKSARQAAPTTRFALMSASDTRTDIVASLAAGFHGFISKHRPRPGHRGGNNENSHGRASAQPRCPQPH